MDIPAYHKSLSGEEKKICALLRKEIASRFSESKIWHGHPVWFSEGNPVVGYSKLKDGIRLLFWSGQTFKERGLEPEGSFKAAQARFTKVEQINTEDLRRWLTKAKAIQWDYKNIVKRKGKLVRLK